MRDFFFGILVVLVVIYGISELYYLTVTRPSFIAQPATVSETPLAPPPTDTYLTGTLIFYPNNVGPIPYLMYKNARGATESKALVWSGRSPLDLSSWAGGRVSVAGYIVREHMVVDSIRYLGGP